jgi:hypothetical protein
MWLSMLQFQFTIQFHFAHLLLVRVPGYPPLDGQTDARLLRTQRQRHLVPSAFCRHCHFVRGPHHACTHVRNVKPAPRCDLKRRLAWAPSPRRRACLHASTGIVLQYCKQETNYRYYVESKLSAPAAGAVATDDADDAADDADCSFSAAAAAAAAFLSASFCARISCFRFSTTSGSTPACMYGLTSTRTRRILCSLTCRPS